MMLNAGYLPSYIIPHKQNKITKQRAHTHNHNIHKTKPKKIKGTSWTLLNVANIWSKFVVHRYLQNTKFNFKLKFHLEDGLVEQRYFELFFSAWSIFSSYKRSLLNEPDFTLFYICCIFGHICCTDVIHFFLSQRLALLAKVTVFDLF